MWVMDITSFRNRLNSFLFDFRRRRLTYILLAVYFCCATIAVVWIWRNADLLVGNFPKDLVIQPTNQNQTEVASNADQSGSNSTKKSSGSSTSSGQTNTGSSSDSSISSTDTSGSSDSSSTPETLSAKVAFYADNQSDSDGEDLIHAAAVNHILATGANPIFHAGDLMEDGTEASFNRFLSVAGTMLASRTFYGALGNNDRKVGDATTPSPIYLDYFNFPGNERWYSVNVGNLHAVILDSAFGAGSAEQLSWLASDLSSSQSQSRLTVVIFHHPTFVSTINSYLVNYGVDLVVDGHLHAYSRTASEGITYVTLSGQSSLGYLVASIYSTKITLSAYNNSGTLTDSATIYNR